jgi:alpha-1,2-glucosyltransferase
MSQGVPSEKMSVASALPLRLPAGPFGLTVVVLAVVVLGLAAVRDVPLLLDEGNHYERIRALREGDAMRVRHASCPHTYHIVLAGLSAALGIDSPDETRLLSLLLGLPCVPLAFAVVRKLGPEGAALRTAQLFFLPVLLPFFFLLYSDTLGLLLVLLALFLALEGCAWGGALASMVAMLVRPTLLCWTLFVFLLPYVREHGWRLEKSALREHLRRSWLYLVGIAGFVLFVTLNRGVAIGDREHHPPFRFHSDSVLFGLFLVFVLFLPLHLANLPRIGRLLLARPWWLLLVAALFLVFRFATSFDHPYNTWRFCLHNKVVNRLDHADVNKLLFFLASAFALLSLAVTRLGEPSFSLLYPLAVLSLAPNWMIEPRYAMPALALFVLLRARRSRAVEWTSLAWSVLLSLLLLDGTFRQVFFL